MSQEDILPYKGNVFSQNGEDGIIHYIFDRIGVDRKLCCEFGAWDGMHLSNCRNLIMHGWHAVMIEGDFSKFSVLQETYGGNPLVKTVHRFVDTTKNRLDEILSELEVRSLDFLSIDIDGLDYQILENIEVRPRVICIEVNAGHDPRSEAAIPVDIAKDNIGQPLRLFCRTATEKGYSLVCYTANAFFVQQDLCRRYSLPSLSSETAYANFLNQLSVREKEWLYLVNLGTVPPYRNFHNPELTGSSLGIEGKRAFALRASAKARQFLSVMRRSAAHTRI